MIGVLAYLGFGKLCEYITLLASGAVLYGDGGLHCRLGGQWLPRGERQAAGRQHDRDGEGDFPCPGDPLPGELSGERPGVRL